MYDKSIVVSIIVPVYNVKAYLNSCIESLVTQTIRDIQIIIVDDGSTDGSSEICEAWKKKDSRILVIHQGNSGVSVARNQGLAYSLGKYVGFVDADDIIANDFYEKMVNVAEKNESDGAFCGYCCVYDNGTKREINPFMIETITAEDAVYECCKRNGWHLTIWNKIFRKDRIYSNNTPILFEKELYIGEDAYWLIQVLQNCKMIACCDTVGYFYRVGREGSAVTQGYKEKRIQSSINRYNANLLCYKFLCDNNNKHAYHLYRRCVFSLKDIVESAYYDNSSQILSEYWKKLRSGLKIYNRANKHDKVFVAKCYLILYLVKLKAPKSIINKVEAIKWRGINSESRNYNI